MLKNSDKQSGFAHIEAILIVVVILLIGGAGYWVVKQNRSNTKLPETLNTAGLNNQTSSLAAVDELNQKDLDEELKLEDELSAQEQKDAEEEAAALNSATEGYNVNF